MDKLSKIQEDIFAGLEPFDILKDLSKEDQMILACNVCKQMASEIDAIPGDIFTFNNSLKQHIDNVGKYLSVIPSELSFAGIKTEIKVNRIVRTSLDENWRDLLSKLVAYNDANEAVSNKVTE